MSYVEIASNIRNLQRENLLIKSQDVVAGSAVDTEVLAAVAGKKHKIYAYGYESDASVEVCFRFGTEATSKWGRRTTQGAFAQTLIRPFVSLINQALNFRTEGAVNVKLWIQYVTEV